MLALELGIVTVLIIVNGLLSMSERAELVGGQLNIRSRPGSGTSVTATIPLPPTRG